VRPLTTGIMATTAKRGKKGRKNDLDDDGGGGGAPRDPASGQFRRGGNPRGSGENRHRQREKV